MFKYNHLQNNLFLSDWKKEEEWSQESYYTPLKSAAENGAQSRAYEPFGSVIFSYLDPSLSETFH